MNPLKSRRFRGTSQSRPDRNLWIVGKFQSSSPVEEETQPGGPLLARARGKFEHDHTQHSSIELDTLLVASLVVSLIKTGMSRQMMKKKRLVDRVAAGYLGVLVKEATWSSRIQDSRFHLQQYARLTFLHSLLPLVLVRYPPLAQPNGADSALGGVASHPRSFSCSAQKRIRAKVAHRPSY